MITSEFACFLILCKYIAIRPFQFDYRSPSSKRRCCYSVEVRLNRCLSEASGLANPNKQTYRRRRRPAYFRIGYCSILLFRVELIFAHFARGPWAQNHIPSIILFTTLLISVSWTLVAGFKGCDWRCAVDRGHVIHSCDFHANLWKLKS